MTPTAEESGCWCRCCGDRAMDRREGRRVSESQQNRAEPASWVRFAPRPQVGRKEYGFSGFCMRRKGAILPSEPQDASTSDWRTALQGEVSMKIRSCLATGASLVAIAAIVSLATGASAHQVLRPYTFGTTPPDPNKPTVHIGPHEAPYVAPRNAKSGTWTDVGNLPNFTQYGPWAPQLLTDGTVLVLAAGTQQWFKLTPDIKGNYTDGTWTAIAPMPSGDCPLYFATQILPDGRMIENGGEYNICGSGESTSGALYDPVADSWTSVSPPSGWTEIGDADSIILPDGTYMLAECCNSNEALASIKGTTVTWTEHSGYGSNSEEGWTALPGGNLLTVDVWNIGSNYDDYETYDTAAGTWSLTGKTPDLLTNGSKELGPAPVTPSYGSKGTIIQFSGNPSLGVNDIYDIASNTWK